MNKEFVPYDWAIELKELGFDDNCLGYYEIDPNLAAIPILCLYKPYKNEFCLPAPLYKQAFRWFREKHNLYGEVIIQQRPSLEFIYGFKISPTNIIQGGFSTYEESELACLSKLIKLIKKN